MIAPDLDNMRYVPKGSTKVVGKGTDAVVYVRREPVKRPDGSTRIKFSAIAYHGKALKSDFYNSFLSEESMIRRITEYFDGRRARAKMMADVKAKNTAPADVKVGDIYVWSGGYNMTRVEFYQITQVIGKRTVEIRQIGAIVTKEFGHYQGEVVASVDGFVTDAPTQRRMVTNGRIKIDTHQSARRWDGKPISFNHND
ncbi:MAG: hypothetical protein EOP83_32485 [Verrucomicrobiaceae bacterium]|nr:MAG: hypothetical protein EOP83_32485 [Verrucomicrobiaceae bacterium]